MHARHFKLVGAFGLATVDDADFGGRPSDVERNHVGLAGAPAQERRGERATRRTRFDQAHRIAQRRRASDRAGIRPDQHQLGGDSCGAQPVGQPIEIGADHRLQVGVGHRRAGPLVLAQVGHHIRRERYRELGPQRVQHCGKLPFVIGIAKAVQ